MSKRVLSIVDLMLGRFARFFPVASWRAWVVVAATIFGLAYGLSPEDQTLALALLGRRVLPGEAARKAFLVIGRRGGKCRFAAWLAVYVACFRDYRGVLAAMIVSRTKDSIGLNNNISVENHTSTFRPVRGYTIVCAVVDEAAYLPDGESAAPDSELLAALRPAMATAPRALLLVLRSPYARRGELWNAYHDHFGKDGDPIIVVQADTRTMNPSVPEDDDRPGFRARRQWSEGPVGAVQRDLAEFHSKTAGSMLTKIGQIPQDSGPSLDDIVFVPSNTDRQVTIHLTVLRGRKT